MNTDYNHEEELESESTLSQSRIELVVGGGWCVQQQNRVIPSPFDFGLWTWTWIVTILTM